MMVKIGSFNMHGMGNRLDQEKEQRIEKISKILKDEDFDLIALQEIQSPDAVNRIASGLGGFKSCHCHDLYMDLKDQGFKNMNDKILRPEYAFIWNPKVLELERDSEIYKGISERMSMRFNAYIAALSALIASVLFALEEKKNDEKEDKQEDTRLLKSLTALGLGGLASTTLASGNASRHADKTSEEGRRKQIADTLHRTLRPPLIGIFKKPSSWRIGGKEIRIIDMHTYFGDDSGKSQKMRMMELSFVLGDIFDVVATQCDGKWRSPMTIVAGDYNMSLAEIETLSIVMRLPEIHKNRAFTTGQGERTTVSIANKEKVQEGAPPEIRYDSSYDHFSYDASIFKKGDPVFSRFNGTNENFIVNNKLISDHVPVKMCFDF